MQYELRAFNGLPGNVEFGEVALEHVKRRGRLHPGGAYGESGAVGIVSTFGNVGVLP